MTNTFTSKDGKKVWTAFKDGASWIARGMFDDGWEWMVDSRAVFPTEEEAVAFCRERTD